MDVTIKSIHNDFKNMSFSNISTNNTFTSRCGESVHDKDYNKRVRIATLYITIIVGTIGGALVFLWMWNNRRLKARVNSLSRVNSFILNLTVADLMVMLLAALPQLVWEYQNSRAWFGGEVLCKSIKFLQSFSMMASTNMLVVIAIDRHQAITKPLKTPVAVYKMAGLAWIVATIASCPMFYVFHLETTNGVPKCENIFRGKPIHHRQAFITYAAIMVFVIPLIILTISYVCIFRKIARKAKDSRSKKKSSVKPGKFHLHSTASNSLPKAKIKTLKMTFVIVMVYILCGIPYFVGEMIMSYGDSCTISMLAYGLIGGLAAANSAANPFVFLLFNVNRKGTRDSRRTFSDGGGTIRTFIYSTASTRSGSAGHDNKGPYNPVKGSVRCQ